MDAHTPKKPERSEKHFWYFAGAVVAAVICTPLVHGLLGLPQFSWEVRIRTSVIVLVITLPFAWLAFRFGRRAGLLIIAVATILFGIWIRLHR